MATKPTDAQRVAKINRLIVEGVLEREDLCAWERADVKRFIRQQREHGRKLCAA